MKAKILILGYDNNKEYDIIHIFEDRVILQIDNHTETFIKSDIIIITNS